MRSHLFYRWWQLKKHVVTGQKMTPLKVRCHRCTDDNVAFKLLSSPMTTLKPRCDLFTTLTTFLLSSDRSKDDTLKITSSSFTKDVHRCNKNTLWSFLRTTTDLLRCHPSPFLLHYLRCYRYHRWHRHICVYIPKKMTPLKIRCSR